MRLTPLILKILVPLFISASFFLFTLLGWNYVSTSFAEEANSAFREDTVSVTNLISNHIGDSVSLLYSLRGLFESSHSVERSEFNTFAQSLALDNNYPSVNLVGYVQLVKNESLPDFVKDIKKDTSLIPEGYPQLNAHPQVSSDKHYILKYVFPEKENLSSLGFDIISSEAIKASLNKAMDNNEPTVTSGIKFIEDNFSFVILLPIYKGKLVNTVEEKEQALDGFVIAALDANKFFNTSLEGQKLVWRDFDLNIFDATGAVHSREQLLFDFQGGNNFLSNDSGSIQQNVLVNFADRAWRLNFLGDKYYKLDQTERVAPFIVLVVGIILSIFLFVLFYTLSNAKQRAVNLAQNITRDIRESEEKFKAVTEAAQDSIIMMKDDGSIVLWNKASELMFGYSEKEVIGKNLHDLITVEPAHKKTENLVHFGMTGESPIIGKVIELSVKKKNGTVFYIELSVARVMVHNKWHAVGIMRDVSERKKNEMVMRRHAVELEKFKLAVDNVSDQIVITDKEGIVLYGNKAVERITGYKPEEALGKKAGKLWSVPMSKSYYDNLWGIIKTQKSSYYGEIKNRRKNGELYDATLTISPVLDEHNEVTYFVGIERDITQQKLIDKAKTEFVSLASHQLRTPLSAINWYAEMLLAGDAGKINKQQKEYVGEIYHGNHRMVDLVNSLLNVSRLELGTFAIEPHPAKLSEIANDVIKELLPMINEKKIKVTKKYDKNLGLVQVDPKLMRIIFQNLLSNAVKYTPPQGKVSIEIGKTDNNILIKVSDNGYGIPKVAQDRIFTKLFRADNAREKDADGTGLGLYIIKSILDNSGGRIWFESEENKGTTFYVIIPADGMKTKVGSKTLT